MTFRRTAWVATLTLLITAGATIPAHASDALCLIFQDWPSC